MFLEIKWLSIRQVDYLFLSVRKNWQKISNDAPKAKKATSFFILVQLLLIVQTELEQPESCNCQSGKAVVTHKLEQVSSSIPLTSAAAKPRPT